MTSLAERRRSSLNTTSNMPISEKMQLHPIQMPNVRRQRCISCSENNNNSSNEEPLLDGTSSNSQSPNVIYYPDVIVTKRSRTDSVCGRIFDDIDTGTVKYFCKSRGHGFITPDSGDAEELFLHISDVEGAYVPRKGDKVSFRLCPIPPKFDKFQAVHVHIVDFAEGEHHRWETPETPEELEAEKQINSMPYDI